MFENVGGKIKVLAVVLFVIEIIAVLIAALPFLENDDGALTIIIIPVSIFIAWVSSLLTYGFGELIECAQDIATSVEKIRNEQVQKNKQALAETAPARTATNINKSETNKREVHTLTASSSKYYCGNCGKDGPYEGNCPVCNSSIRRYIVE